MGRESSHSLRDALDSDALQIRYERELVVGGIGTLWLGRLVSGTEAGRVVLLRRIAKDILSESEVESLKKIAEAYARVRHPTLVKLLGIVEQDRDVISISEHLDGVRLGDLLQNAIDRDQPVPATVAVRVVLDAARASIKAHRLAAELGLFPSERLFLPEGVFIAGFGGTLLSEVGVLSAIVRCQQPRGIADLIAQLSPEELAKTSAPRGSPEVFSLGVLLWEMLANRRLFSRESESRAREALLELPIEPLDHVERCGMPVPEALVDIVRTSTARRPDHRYTSIEQFATALEALPAHFIATEHHVATALRDQAADLMRAFHVDASQTSLTMAFSEVPASRMSTRPPPEDAHNWDVPTFAQSQLVSSAATALRRSLPNAAFADPTADEGDARKPIEAAVGSVSVRPSAASIAARSPAEMADPRFQRSRDAARRRLVWVTIGILAVALLLLVAGLLRKKLVVQTQAEVPKVDAQVAARFNDPVPEPATAPAAPTQESMAVRPLDPTPLSEPAHVTKQPTPAAEPEPSIDSEAATSPPKAKTGRITFRPHQIAPYRPKGI